MVLKRTLALLIYVKRLCLSVHLGWGGGRFESKQSESLFKYRRCTIYVTNVPSKAAVNTNTHLEADAK